MRRFASIITITTYLLTFLQADLRFAPVYAQSPSGTGAGTLAHTLGLGPVARPSGPSRPGPSAPASAGLPSNLNSQSPLSTALMAVVGGRGQQLNEATLFGDWDGREDHNADHSQKTIDFSFLGPLTNAALTRSAISAHTYANGFDENIYYYGASDGSVAVAVDYNPDVSPDPIGSTDDGVTIHLPTALHAFLDLQSDIQVVVTGLCVNPVADLTTFADVNPAYAPFAGKIGEILYVTFMDTGSGIRLTANGLPIRSGVLAFPISDDISPSYSPPEIQSDGGFPVTVGGAFAVAFSTFSNLAGCAVDDDGSLYFQQVDLQQFTGGNIVKVTETGPEMRRTVVGASYMTLTTLNPGNGVYNIFSATPTQTRRATNYSGTSTAFGNIAALAAGPNNTLFAAMAASNDGTPSSGLFANPAALGATPSMIVSFADTIGEFSNDPKVVVTDGFADAIAGTEPATPGVNNFRAFVLGNGPDRRAASGDSPVFGTLANTLKLSLQVDYTIYSGLAIDEERKVSVVSGGTPAGVGRNPSPDVGEILMFGDRAPADRRADYLDRRGNTLPNAHQSGGNIGDTDSDRFDHIFAVAPIDAFTAAPTGLAGLSRGFLRYIPRLAPNPISGALTLGSTTGNGHQGDDSSDGPIVFSDMDPGHQVGGGDDQNTPFRGDDSAGAGDPALVNGREGGFEYNFGAIVAGMCTAAWNGFYLNSNGSVSFSGGNTDNSPTSAEFLAGPPTIAGAWGDLNPDARVSYSNQFPVQALGFSGVNSFKVRWINAPRFGAEEVASRNSFAITLFDDGTGIDENNGLPFNPANPIGNNAVPFDGQEGPTDLVFVSGAVGTVASPLRPEGSAQFRLDYDRMDAGVNLDEFIAGYSTGLGTAVAEGNLGTLGRTALIGVGTESALFEQFSANDWDLRAEGNDPIASAPAGQPDASTGTLTFFGKACVASQVQLNVETNPTAGGTLAGTGVSCPGDCFESYASGSNVVLTATPAVGFHFSAWNGCDAPSGTTCTMTMTGPRQVAALFLPDEPPPPSYPLSVAVNGTSFSPAQTLVATVTLDPVKAGPGPVDAYVVVQFPSGSVFSLQMPLGANAFVPGLAPLASNFVPFALSAPVISIPLAGAPPGNYTIFTALAQPGTLNIIGTVNAKSFVITP